MVVFLKIKNYLLELPKLLFPINL